MKLQTIFDQLVAGELSQLCIGGQEPGVINEDNRDKVISHVNLALTAIFKRFFLKEGRLKLQLHDDIGTYVLTSRHAVNGRGGSSETKYIIDTVSSKFKDDILKVERVYTDEDYEMGLNDLSNPYALSTPTMTSLRVPEKILLASSDLPTELQTEYLTVVYRANCQQIVPGLGYFDPANYEVELPHSHLEPLLWFVASRINNPTGMQNEFHAGNSYAAKYEMACQQLEGFNLAVDQGSQNNRLRSKGFV